MKSISEGRWLLVYVDYDSMESWGHERCVVRAELDATNESDAVAEGLNRWSVRLAAGTYTSVGGEVFPNTPRVIYEVSL